MALYAVAATPAPWGLIARLRTKIARCVDARAASHRSVVFALNAVAARTLDPLVHLLAARMVAIRRAWHIDSRNPPHLAAALGQYEIDGCPTIFNGAVPDQGDNEGPFRWNDQQAMKGPVGLLLHVLQYA